MISVSTANDGFCVAPHKAQLSSKTVNSELIEVSVANATYYEAVDRLHYCSIERRHKASELHQQKNNGQKLRTNPLSPRRSFKNKMSEKINIRSIGVAFFVGASIFCLYEIWNLRNEISPRKQHYTGKLKLVSIFNRHGDRAPSDGLPKGDRHAEKPLFFWPNGLHNLTDLGKYREYRIGLETRRKYNDYIDYDSNRVLAYSSPVYRCQESLRETLRGLFNMEWTKDKGRAIGNKLNCTNCFPNGSGSPDEWKKIPIDTDTIRALNYEVLNECKYRKEHPSPVDTDLTASQHIRSLIEIKKLKEIIKKTYDQDFSFPALGIWSTISSEMNIVRTKETYEYTKHYNDWINEVIYSKRDVKITLFDLYEAACVLGYRDRVVDESYYVQVAPIITSLIESQMVALGENITHKRMEPYKNKSMIFYSSHDSILQLILHGLQVINMEGSFEKRFEKWYRSSDEVGKFLAGLKMSSFGMSYRFELWELESAEDKTRKFPYVQMSIYNKEDAKYQDIEYRLAELGSACQRLFKKKFPRASSYELELFYDPYIQFDRRSSCPFALFRNVTANLIVEDKKMHQLCDN